MTDASTSRRARSAAFLGLIVSSKPLFIGGAIILLVVLTAILGPLLTPYTADQTSLMDRFQPPSAEHWAGTDSFGRDVMTRLLNGASISLFIGLASVTITTLIGVSIGSVAGFFPKFDNVIMRFMDAGEAFPTLLMAIALSAILGPGLVNVILALGIAYAPRTARIVRASVLVLAQQQFIEAARASNASGLRIILTHLIPNTLAAVVVQMTFVFADAVLAEAALSFIGVGPPPPAPTWGNIIADGRTYIYAAPWITIFPGIAIFLTVLSLNLVGDGLRDQLDPRLKDRS